MPSSCCKSTVTVVGGDEGTNHWECDACHKACDDVVTPEEKTWSVVCLCGSRAHEIIDCPYVALAEKEWWHGMAMQAFSRGTMEQCLDKMGVIVRESARRAVEKRDGEVKEMIEKLRDGFSFNNGFSRDPAGQSYDQACDDILSRLSSKES